MVLFMVFIFSRQYLTVDPSLEEEGVMDGRMTIAMNTHQEVCVLQLTGGVAILPDQVCRVRGREIVTCICSC